MTSFRDNGFVKKAQSLLHKVFVKDLVSRIVMSQFREPIISISILCFDPGGLLLVIIYIHGDNINIF